MKLYGKEISKQDLLKHIGNVSQLGGVELNESCDGLSKGVRTVTFRTAEGLEYIVLPDNGMGISSCYYKGIPICWKSGTGVTNPGFYDPRGSGWLRSFNGGLLVTCGLSQIGNACNDNNNEYGLHGRISNIPAELTSVQQEWKNDNYFMSVKGTLRESMALGERLVLRRKISSYLDSSQIMIKDVVTNESWYKSPLLLSYHINFGYPFVSKNTKVKFFNSIGVDYYNAASNERGISGIEGCDKPTKGFKEQIYLQKQDSINGFKVFEVNNTIEEKQLSVKVSFSENLNYLIHWRQFGEGDYVLGFEPANTTINGRTNELANNNVVYLNAQESIEYTLIFDFSLK